MNEAWIPDWKDFEKEALARFRDLLRLKTVNPPGNEELAARYIEKTLKENGIDFETVEPSPGRRNVVARLKGKSRDNALLLCSHTDVVPVEEEKWSHPPFGGEIHGGYLFGRGAIDMKNMTALGLMTVLTLKRRNVPLNRDVVLAAVADEEDGFANGSKYLVERRPELLEGEYVLNELGGFTLHVNGRRVYPVQVAEKGLVWMRMTASGKPGHGSIPNRDNAVVTLARALRRIDRTVFPLRPTPYAKAFMEKIAQALPPWKAAGLMGALHPATSDLLFRTVFADSAEGAVFYSLLHNTVSATGLQAGKKTNVIPAEASAVLDCRVVPGVTPEEMIGEIRRAVGGNLAGKLTFEVLDSSAGAASGYDTPLYRLLEKGLREADPGCIVAPYFLSGASDACHYTRLGLKAYGFSPVKLPEGLVFSDLFHGHDERIPVDGFFWGLRLFYNTVLSFVADA